MHIQFIEATDLMGGEKTFGQPIAEATLEDGILYQYFESGLLTYNASAVDATFYKMAPLAIQMGIEEPPVPPPADPTLLYVNGHIIFPDFLLRYHELSGAEFIGKPVTEARFNPVRQRYEQYFENAGLYRKEDAGVNQVGLLAYGTTYCRASCIQILNPDTAIDIQAQVETPFGYMLDQLTRQITGFALTPAYQSQDGRIEQIFENLVITAHPDNLAQAELKSLPMAVHIAAERAESPIGNPDYYYYEIEPGYGFNIPQYFWSYLQERNLFQVAGLPTTRLTPKPHGRFQQCFTKLCLMYDPAFPADSRVRLWPLGYVYKDIFAGSQASDPNGAGQGGQPDALLISAREKYPSIQDGEFQEIYVTVTRAGAPVAGAELILKITMPDGRRLSYEMPPSDAAGQTMIQLPVMEARSYSLVPYEVCLTDSEQSQQCRQATFVVINPS